MNVQTIPRSAVDGYLKLLRVPANAVVGVLGTRNGGTDTPAGTIALDRFEARLRSIAGRTLRDDELVRDAERRRLAADERERAEHACGPRRDRRSELAEARLSEREKKAEQQRRQAARRAAERKKRAGAAASGGEPPDRRSRVAAPAREREGQRPRKEEAIEDRSKRARLRQLDDEADALAASRPRTPRACKPRRPPWGGRRVARRRRSRCPGGPPARPARRPAQGPALRREKSGRRRGSGAAPLRFPAAATAAASHRRRRETEQDLRLPDPKSPCHQAYVAGHASSQPPPIAEPLSAATNTAPLRFIAIRTSWKRSSATSPAAGVRSSARSSRARGAGRRRPAAIHARAPVHHGPLRAPASSSPTS